jgi:hypothetical protein
MDEVILKSLGLMYNGNSGPIREHLDGGNMATDGITPNQATSQKITIPIMRGKGISSFASWVLEPLVESPIGSGNYIPRVFRFDTASTADFPGVVRISLQGIGLESGSGYQWLMNGFIADGKYRNKLFTGYYNFRNHQGWIEFET